MEVVLVPSLEAAQMTQIGNMCLYVPVAPRVILAEMGEAAAAHL